MDLNYLFHRHGMSLLMANHAACDTSRRAHREMAAAYAVRIADYRDIDARVAA